MELSVTPRTSNQASRTSSEMPTQSARDFASTMKARSKSVGSIFGRWPQPGDDVPPAAAAAAKCL
eukprot:12414769-Heterocapsa_arctica.AAC.1